MASLAEINIRIGAKIDELEKGLRRGERGLQGFARRAEGIGRSLSLSISAPLAAIGGLSVKAFADFDRLAKGLEITMTSAGRTVEEAKAEIAALREEANKPGLTFDNLLQGSIKLQSVGFSAEKARESLVVFGNALALAGGSAQDLDGVNLALTQIVSKGNVFAEEINQIAERVPQIRTAMIAAFGTARTEDIQALKLSSEEFIDAITKELAKLPKAPENLANSFKNLQQSVQISLQQIGGSLEQNLNISGRVAAAAKSIESLTKAFTNLSPRTQDIIIKTGLLLTALGPLTFLVGKTIQGFKTMSDVVSLSKEAFIRIQASAIRAASALQTLTAAQLGFLTLGAAAIIAALIIAYRRYANALSEAERVERSLKDVRNEAIQSIAGEQARTELLVKVLKDEASTKDDKLKAINELNKISPEYFSGLKLEGDTVKGLNDAYPKYLENLKKTALQKAANAKIDALSAQKLEKELQLTEESGKSRFLKIASGVFTGETAVQRLTKEISALDKEIAALGTISFENIIDTPTAASSTESIFKGAQGRSIKIPVSIVAGDFGGNAEIQKLQQQIQDRLIQSNAELKDSTITLFEGSRNALTEYGEQIAYADALQQRFGASFDGLSEKIAITQSAIDKLLNEGVNPFSPQIDLLTEKLETLKEQQDKVNNSLNAQNFLVSSLTPIFEDFFTNLAEGGKNAGRELIKSIGRLITKLVAAAAAALALQAILAALFPGSTVAIGAAGGGSALAGVVGQLSGLKFADGGVVRKPTLGLIGEYPGATSNPEIVAPSNLMRKIVREEGGGGRLSVDDIVISGDQLRIVLREAERRNSRYGG